MNQRRPITRPRVRLSTSPRTTWDSMRQAMAHWTQEKRAGSRVQRIRRIDLEGIVTSLLWFSRATFDMHSYDRARQLVDAAHAADPQRTSDGQAAELVYAERMERWIEHLQTNAPPLLRLAARCQHLERWFVPRDSFPLDKVGYHAWRRSLYIKQAERARSLLREAGISEAEAADVAMWVAKSGLKTNPGTQALEDAACLVFLENEIESFAAQHAQYPREKFIDIIRKTWRKMSPRAQEFAVGLTLSESIAGLIRDAVATAE